MTDKIQLNLGSNPEQYLQQLRDTVCKWRSKSPDFVHAMCRGIDGYASGKEPRELPMLLGLKDYPVSVEEFLFSPDYLYRPRDELYPVIIDELIKLNNPNDFRVVNPYAEAVFSGGIGSGKTTLALLTQLYQLYVLSCLRNPHRSLGLDSASEIMFIIQSASGGLAKMVDYQRMRMLVEQSTYFRTVYPYDKQRLSELVFPQRVIVKPVGTDIGALGQNVISGIIDELNFMAVVQQSKRTQDHGVYNQALVIYEGISRRRKSRFARGGSLPGILCLVSSKRYPGEFTDIKMAEAKDDPSIYVYDKRVWDVKPPGSFTMGMFRVYGGTMTAKARILDEDEVEPDIANIHEVPWEFRREFEGDLIGSLRDIAGVSTMARHPYFSSVEQVSKCFGKTASVLNVESSDMKDTPVTFAPEQFRNTQWQRWVHVDLGVTSDAAGIACGYVDRFVPSINDPTQMLPHITMDFILRVPPPLNGEIQFHKIRTLIIKLRDHGLPIRWVSYDSFQSFDSIQLLRLAKFQADLMDMSRTVSPYAVLKTAMYDERVACPPHKVCHMEILSLEQDLKGKIDHPPLGSKDCADALSGVVYGLTMQRAVWHAHGMLFNSARGASTLRAAGVVEAHDPD